MHNLSKMQNESLVKKFRSESTLSPTKYEIVSQLGKYTEERPTPDKFKKFANQKHENGDTTILLEEEIENIQQFYNWVDILQEKAGSQEDKQYQ